jgi:uncharacterized protein (DUF2384 family)
VVKAIRTDAQRRLGRATKLSELDGETIKRAVKALGSPQAAGEWLISPAFGLGGAIPVELARTEKGRATVLNLLGRIEYGVL